MNIWECYLRWRHSKGFGVHSPYAYRFITDVVRPGPYGYYAYHSLKSDRSTASDDFFLSRKEKKFIIRIINFLKTRRLVSLAYNPDIEEIAGVMNIAYHILTGEDNSFKINSAENDLLVLNHSGMAFELLEEAISCGARILAYGPSEELRRFLLKPLKKGLAIDWKTKVLLIPRNEMEYLRYAL